MGAAEGASGGEGFRDGNAAAMGASNNRAVGKVKLPSGLFGMRFEQLRVDILLAVGKSHYANAHIASTSSIYHGDGMRLGMAQAERPGVQSLLDSQAGCRATQPEIGLVVGAA